MAEWVLVAGATGGVGQLTVAKLLEKGYFVRVLTRNPEKAQKMFSDSAPEEFRQRIEYVMGDIRQPETLSPATTGVAYIICCTGTTAFPSERWEFDLPQQMNPLENLSVWSKIFLDSEYRNAKANNSPAKVDAAGVSHLVSAAPQDLKRFVFVSSCGVDHKTQFPYTVLNAFGVLDAKQQGEEAVKQSGLPYTIIRPGRLIDGPYTSYDLNTLLKATTNGQQGIVIGTGDTLTGQTSRIDVAAACVECLNYPTTERKTFEIINQGSRPATIDWTTLFSAIT